MEFNEIKKLYHIDKKCGFPEKTIQAACSNYGILPNVLIEYYRNFGKHRGLNHAFYHLCPPDKLEYLVYGNYLCFFKASDEPLYWFLDLDQPKSDNPPVYRRYFNGSSVCDRLDCESLVKFFHVMAYWQALFYLPCKSKGSVRCTLKQAAGIKKLFLLKPYQGILWPPFYGNNSSEVIYVQEEVRSSSAQVLYACTSQERFREISAVIAE